MKSGTLVPMWKNGRQGTYILYGDPKVSEPRAYVIAVCAIVCSHNQQREGYESTLAWRRQSFEV